MELRGRTAIVTGAAVRIGRELALTLADLGADVCVHYGESDDAARRTVEEIRARGVRATAVSADLAEPVAAAERIFAAAREAFGRIDVLVNCASVWEPGTLADLDAGTFRRTLDVNLHAPLQLCRAFAAQVPAHGRGLIVQLLDGRVARAAPGRLAYTLSKAGLAASVRLLALELAPRIRVNAIAPGAVLAPVGREADHAARAAETIPLRRTGTPQDVARALRYLLESDFVTGETLHVTGGEGL